MLLLFIVFSCRAPKNMTNYFDYEIECLGVELDGSQTVKAWGSGRNRADAIEQAQKNAVNAVIFRGINNGKNVCDVRPLLTQPNARETYSDYFNIFFSDDGSYKDFVSFKDERILLKLLRNRKRSKEGVSHGIVLRILRSELKKKLINDGILVKD